MSTDFHFRGRNLQLTGKPPVLMGILNVTPDSFSDGGRYNALPQAVDHALEMLDSGAGMIDIGGETTKPGAPAVSNAIEAERLLPAVREIKKLRPSSIISVDTRKADVARCCLEAGADIINDVSGLQYSAGMAALAAEYQAGLVIMHMRGTPDTMQSPENLCYGSLLDNIRDFLEASAARAIAAGVSRDSIILDPGIGFSKNFEQNIEILRNLDFFRKAGMPLLIGASRKAFIGKILNEPVPEKRIWGTAGVTAWLTLRRTEIIRVHDVAEMAQLMKVLSEIAQY